MQIETVKTVGPRPVGIPGPRVARPGPAAAVEGVLLRDESPTARAYAAAVAARRRPPPGVLYAMFERMGGARTSVWKGMYVDVVV